jgi:hypothetical protein
MKKIKLLTALLLALFSKSFAQTDTLIGKPSGYTNIQLRSTSGISIDQGGNIWISFSLIGLTKFDGSSWTVYDSLNSGLLNNRVLSVANNTMGVWAGTDTGLYNFDGINWTRMTVAGNNLLSDTINNLYSPGGLELYIFSFSGFSFFNGTAWQHFNTVNSGLVSDSVQCLFKDAAGILWIGTKHGLSRHDGSTWQNFTTANTELWNDDIRSLTEDGYNQLFVSTDGSGVYFYNGADYIQLRDSVNSYYNFPLIAGKLFGLQNGSVLQSFQMDIIYTTNPIGVQQFYSGFSASDSLYFAAVDASDRVWRINKRTGLVNLWMRDSLEYYPVQTPPSNYQDLDINQVRCGMFNNASLHWELIGTAKYEVPKGSGKNSVFASGFWIGGLDSIDNLHIGAQTYRQSGNDFWPGPLDTVSATIDPATLAQYDSLWKINRSEIDEFRTQFDAGNVTSGSYPVPGIILNWPAHGSGNYSRRLAPFIDHNADGVYNPMDGDYPDIKGDQMIWWVMNDHAQNNHLETDGIPLGLEVHASAYAYNCLNIPDSNEAVNYTTFYSFDFINRSDTDYHDVYVGMYVDVDLGNYLDDYVACNVENDFGMVYNGDNIDEGVAGYGVNPPMQNMAVLKGPVAEPNDSIDNNHNGVTDEPDEHCMMNHFMYYNNNSDPVGGNPAGAMDYYNYLRSFWRNGNHMTYGGNGHGGGIGATVTPTDYYMPGTPYDTGWTEVAAGNLPSDRRMLLSAGPFSLPKGETRTIDYAYIFTHDESAPNGLNTSVAKNLADVKRIKRWFDTDSFPCNNSSVGINEPEQYLEFSVYPNPATESLNVIRYPLTGTATLELYNVVGEKIRTYEFPAGRKEMTVKVSTLSKGIYFLKLNTDTGTAAKKVVIK